MSSRKEYGSETDIFKDSAKLANKKESDREYDIFKDSLVRYFGYANEVGEAFRALVPVTVVWASYGVASTYVVADAIDKGLKASKQIYASPAAKQRSVGIAFTDTLIWQGFASVIIPGFTINRLCLVTAFLLKQFSTLPGPVRRWGTTVIGLGCIPFIIHPIDHGVDFVMDKTVREWYGHHPRRKGLSDKTE